jgi:hypothetical protein
VAAVSRCAAGTPSELNKITAQITSQKMRY